MRRLATMLAMILILAACAGSGESTSAFDEIAGDAAEEPAFDDSAGEEEFARATDAGDVDLELVSSDRNVIRRASLSLHASDTRAAFDEIVRIVESEGGFVAQATVFPTETEERQPEVAATLRVPADRLTPILAAIKETADEVVSESQGAEDVTEQFIDLEARLANLEALEIELRALLQEVRQQPDADPEKLLRVFNEISDVRSQIEQLQGQLDYLRDRTSLATVEVRIIQTPATAPIVDEPWAPAEAARESVRSLVTALQGIADWGINFALFVLPVLVLTVGIPLGIGWALFRRFRRRSRTAEPPSPVPEA